MSALAPGLQAFFTDRLIGQRAASPNTIGAYKTSLRLLLGFAAQRTAKAPAALDIAELDAPLIAAFLGHLEADRHNSVATRNNRLAAVHSLFAYLALHHPEHAASIQRVLAIPPKRTERNLVTYLTDPEVDALLGACDQTSWTGRRDHAMFALTVQTGLRISELAGLSCQDVTLGAGANVHTVGQRPQRTAHTAGASHESRPQGLARRAPRRAHRPPVPDRHRRAPQPRRHRTTPHPAPDRRGGHLPILAGKTRHHAHAPTHRGHAPAARGQRRHRHRPVARPRADRDDQPLPARRHEPQAAGDRPDQTARRQARSLSAIRLAARLPRSPLIMPTTSGPLPP